MFRHAELCFVSRGIELIASSLSRLQLFTRTETNQYVKVLRIVDPINYGNSSDATRKQKNMSERENGKKKCWWSMDRR